MEHDEVGPDIAVDPAVVVQRLQRETDLGDDVENQIVRGAGMGDHPGRECLHVAASHEHPSTAHITERAIGAAATPPWPPCSTMTATATLGLAAGAKLMNHACGC